MGGLKVSIASGAGSLLVSHFVYDETNGISAIMKTFERDPSETPGQHTLRAPMLALATPDPTLGFPANVALVPELLLRNTITHPIDASVVLNWRNTATSGQVAIPSAPLKPGEVRIVKLADVAAQAGVPGNAYWGTITLKYQGRYGDIVPIASSFDVSGKYGMQTPFDEGLNRLWKGSMWHVDSMRNSLITTGNGGSEPTHAAVTLFYKDGKSSYTIEQLLQPGQQIWVDVGSIIRNRVPDKDGNLIPTDVMMGSYELRDLDHPTVGSLFEGKLVIDKTWGHGYYGCSTCCGYADASQLDPNPYTDFVGNGTWNNLWKQNVCTDTEDDLASWAYNWASDNTGVATVANAYTSLVGVGGANASASVQFQSNIVNIHCPMRTSTPQAPVNAYPPLTISGPTEVWYFVGAQPANTTAYPTSITLNASGGPSSSYTWAITTGSGAASLSTTTGSSTTVTGSYATSQGGVAIQVTSSGAALGVADQIKTINISVVSPYRLAIVAYVINPDSTYAYQSVIQYSITDSLNRLLPAYIEFNEHFTSGVIPDYNNPAVCPFGPNWTREGERSGTVPPGDAEDQITGALSVACPPPVFATTRTVYPDQFYTGTKVHHWYGGFWAGSLSPGLGYQVQSNSWYRYLDHATNEDRTTPVPH